MFKIYQEPLEKIDLKAEMPSSEGGALVTFEGFVRESNEGKTVELLEYEVFDALAQAEGEKILAEAKEKFSALAVKCVHRSGTLKIGEMAVWVGVVAGHRREAFEACRYIIDEIKKRLPIWKKEHYAGGIAQWVNCRTQVSHADPEREFYSRQINLKDVGESGQKKLKNARVLVVGAGGLGAPALLYLASAGIGTIGIVDSDNLETSNLHRQVLYSLEDVGKPKAELAAKRLKALNPFIHVRAYPKRVAAENVYDIAQHYTLILDCSDNFPTKFLLNDFAAVAKIPLISASVYQLEGQMLFYDPAAGSSCLRCLWPEIPDTACDGVCDTAGILGVVPGVFGTLQAAEAVKYILGFSGQLASEILTVDLATYYTSKIRLPKDPHCPVCGTNPAIKIIDRKNYESRSSTDVDIARISKNEFLKYVLIDVREAAELDAKPVRFETCVHIPISALGQSSFPFDKGAKYLLFCETNARSRQAAQRLREKGISEVFSVHGGADAVRKFLADNHIESREGISR